MKGQGKCPYCSSHKVKKGFNDLETWCRKNNSDLLKMWDYHKNDLLPSDYLPNSGKKIYWKCIDCGTSWEASVSSAIRWAGCPKCRKANWDKVVQQYDLAGILIGQYESVKEAANTLHFDMSAIRKACRGEKPSYKGFIWKYAEKDNKNIDMELCGCKPFSSKTLINKKELQEGVTNE